MPSVFLKSQLLEEHAATRKATRRPKTPMMFATETCPELVRKNPPPIWMPTDLPWKCESIPPPAQVVLNVTSQFGGEFVIKCYPFTKIAAVKKMIKDKGGVEAARQRMYLLIDEATFTTLEDDKLVGDYEGITEYWISLFEEQTQ